MAAAIVSLISVALLIAGIGSLAQGSFFSVNQVSQAQTRTQDTSVAIARTRVEVIKTTHTPPTADVTVKNTGQEALADFKAWDLLAQYYESAGAYHIQRLTYIASGAPGANQWTVVGIYVDAANNVAEVFQPNVLDPQEEMIIRINLSPAAGAGAKNMLDIATPNGVAVSTMF